MVKVYRLFIYLSVLIIYKEEQGKDFLKKDKK